MSSSRLRIWLVRLFVAVVIASGGGVARAQADNTKEAGDRFDLGLEFFEAGDYAAALAEFEEAYRLAPHYAVLFNIGVTQKRLFQYGEAVRTLRRYLDAGGKDIPPERRTIVEQELAEIRSLTAEVKIVVNGPAGARIAIDGDGVGVAPLGDTVLVRPGRHTLTATLGGYRTATETIQVVSGQSTAVELTLIAIPKSAQLSISSQPGGAGVAIDGKRVGSSPWEGELPAGPHRVQVALEGYVAQERRVVLRPEQALPISFALQPVDRPNPIYKRWYFWAAASVLVAGGATTVYFLQRDPGPDVTINYP